MNILNLRKLSISQKISIISIIISVTSVIVSICVSIYTLNLASQANLNSIQANNIAVESKNINKKQFDLNVDERSQRISQLTYNNIYDDVQSRQTMMILKSNLKVNNDDNLLKIVDSLEEAGLSFCQGTALVRHIKMYLKNSLSVVCSNKEISEKFAQKKNGLALLCYDFFPDSIFAQYFNKENINTCSFIDSNRFKNIVD